jgi:DMSO reductase anchor subunit
LDFGEIDTNVVADVPGFTDRRIWPGIKIIPLRNRRRPDSEVPTLTEREHEAFKRVQISKNRKSSLKSEWPLILFTMLAALLFAVTATALIAGPVIEPVAYIALAVGGLIVSAVHLGSPLRAWRALSNIRSSWLSREVVAYTLFVGSSGWFLLELPSTSVGIVSVFLGLATLVSIDMVYATVERSYAPIGKRGSILLTGILLFAVLAQMSVLVMVLLIGIGVAYIRGLSKAGLRNVKRILASSVRIAVGIILPILLLGAQGNVWFVAMFVLLGETINRGEFYLDLDVVTPRRQIQRDLFNQLDSMVKEQS